ncbi:probable carboxylesterase 120 [Mangifera indica]|uniref:probable carboxylesterase 120 n=1 Tax=Mangifera indica TaxID=29780 RepID=UPI001CFB2431|nr:probable carboxylesterase 120 [Mangifera indica]
MAAETTSTSPTIDPYQFIPFSRSPDGTVTRNNNEYFLKPIAGEDLDPRVFFKDVPINSSNNTWIRIFLPREAIDSSSTRKLPLIVYYHGGGFVLGSVDDSIFHEFCSNVALEYPAVVVSVQYRLAPEYRLPAAYDDSMEALNWIKTTQDELLTKHADFSSCFLMGISAGANLAYHIGLRVAAQVEDLLPFKIKGLILQQPFIGGVKRTESELRLMNNQNFPVCLSDLMWELSLPHGADRDHEYCNLTMGGGSDLLDRIKQHGWKVLITATTGDPMIDRQIEMVKMMEQKALQVKSHYDEGGYHGIDLLEPEKRTAVPVIMKDFVTSAMAQQ